MTVGTAIALYGVSLLIGLSEVSIGKFSAGARDTSSALLIALLGVALALYGWFHLGSEQSTERSPTDEA
ncbi:hypothetical protein N799_01970 [Lysobacter arseniciresistens ZS79]|uniref:Uncharacterized protein n=2 Tax=Novilysobacter TaxID=3382699 RepID=A0A0A0F3N2_9GAMM|nr:hypothetical protein N799_01970 [Lysobacter arseniciresistens ZS79]